ncbi:alkyl hydroperoxide reductase [Erysipelotrichaceae bacterium]|nr:alkyl hydroperoxide reductase [Erysipelotrichaceae bacterium]
MCNNNNSETIYYATGAKVGKAAPKFEMEALLADGSFGKVTLQENMDAGKWTILYFYPLDFTFVCPTEIKAMSDANAKFTELNTVIISASTDSVYSHLAWTNTPALGKIKHAMGADTTHAVSEDYGVLDDETGTAVRGLFIIDPEGKLVQATVNDNSVGRNVDEVVRLLEAFQTGGLAPCGWTPGDNLL